MGVLYELLLSVGISQTGLLETTDSSEKLGWTNCNCSKGRQLAHQTFEIKTQYWVDLTSYSSRCLLNVRFTQSKRALLLIYDYYNTARHVIAFSVHQSCNNNCSQKDAVWFLSAESGPGAEVSLAQPFYSCQITTLTLASVQQQKHPFRVHLSVHDTHTDTRTHRTLACCSTMNFISAELYFLDDIRRNL